MVDIKTIMRENTGLRLISITLFVITILILASNATPRQDLANQSSNLSNGNPLSLTSLKEASSSLIIFLITLFILVIGVEVIYRLLLDEIKSPVVLPFETNDEKELDGQAITDSIIANLQRIHDVLPKSETLLRSEAELLSIPTTGTTGIMWEDILKNSEQENNRVTDQLKDSVKLTAGGWELLVLPLISAVFRLRKIGDNGCIIRGSFQKYGENVFGHAIVKTKIISFACETRGSYGQLPDLIKDLAFDIAFNLSETKRLGQIAKEHTTAELPCNRNDKKENKNCVDKLKMIDNNCKNIYKHSIKTAEGWIGLEYYYNIIRDLPNETKTFKKNIERLEKCYGNRDESCEKKYGYFYNRKDGDKDFKAEQIGDLNTFIFKGINSQDGREWSHTTQKIMDRCKNRDECYHLNRLQLEEVCPDLKDRLPIKTSMGLKYFTEATYEFLQYKSTENIEHLNSAKNNCDSAYREENNANFLSMFHGLGLAYYNKGNFKTAGEMFAEVIKENPNAVSFSGKGFCRKYQVRFKDAIDEFENAISYDRDYDKPWILLGAIYFNLGLYAVDLYDISIACFHEALKRNSKSPYPWMIMSLIYYRRSCFQKGITFNSAIAVVNNEANLRSRRRLQLPKADPISMINNYNNIALKCIQRSIELSKKYGYKEFFAIQLDQEKTLKNLVDPKMGKRKKYSSSYLLKKDPYDRACQASLRNRTKEAKRELEVALEKKLAYEALVLFDPDLDNIERKDREEILKNYPVDIERLNEIRSILNENLIINNPYILASFEATCHYCDEAIKILKNLPDSDLKRFEMDPHFESIQYLAVLMRINKKSKAQGLNTLKIVVIKTSEDQVIALSVVVILPKGVIFASTRKNKKIVKLKQIQIPKKRWELHDIINEKIIQFDEKALGFPAKVNLIAQFKCRNDLNARKRFESVYHQILKFEELGNESGNMMTFQITRKIIFVQDGSQTQLSHTTAEPNISLQNIDEFSIMAGF